METNRELTFRFLAEPTDINFGGKVHGGAVMKWLDQAAYACAARWSSSYCVTVFVSGIHFVKPIYIGNVVEINSKIIYTGKTSMHIALEVRSKLPQESKYVMNTHCSMVFVALDKEGKKISVPKWKPETIEDKKAEEYALKMKEMYMKFEAEVGRISEH